MEHFLPPQAGFWCFSMCFSRFFSTLPIMSDLFVCGSRGPKSVPVLHHFVCFRPRRTWAHKRCRNGCRGCRSTFCHRKAGLQVPGRRHGCVSTGAGLGCCLCVTQRRRVVQLLVCSESGKSKPDEGKQEKQGTAIEQGKTSNSKEKQGQAKESKLQAARESKRKRRGKESKGQQAELQGEIKAKQGKASKSTASK